ncbi:sulfotransferase [Nocardioides sp. SYSU D00038]|uniref:sulfotransferase n=1 Tax=Nocardioides sp. SYSU D00038 TaxID=2812554 RepID=UPI0019688868|nr:sulfotransferase [Nocardioides sp. SYSU D00038]
MRGLVGRRAALARLEAENAALRDRLARLEGRPDLGYLFVMTYGRSGSTVLNSVLNTVPGYTIRGENRAALRHLHQFHATMLAEKRRRGAATRTPGHPWYGIAGYPERRALEALRALALQTVLRPEPGTRVTGFKEIRWYHDDLADHVGWLREVFPGARFVVNTRNHADVLRSGWWAEQGPGMADRLAEIERDLLAVAADLGDAAHHVHYDDYAADPTALRPLFDWLGEPFDEDALRATMSVRLTH